LTAVQSQTVPHSHCHTEATERSHMDQPFPYICKVVALSSQCTSLHSRPVIKQFCSQKTSLAAGSISQHRPERVGWTGNCGQSGKHRHPQHLWQLFLKPQWDYPAWISNTIIS